MSWTRTEPPKQTLKQIQAQQASEDSEVPTGTPAVTPTIGSWTVREHPLAVAARRNPRLSALLNIVDDLNGHRRLAARCADMITEVLHSEQDAPVTVLDDADDVTHEWLDEQMVQRRAAADRAERLQLLAETRHWATEAAWNAIERNGVRLVEQLAVELDDVLTHAETAVDSLGPGVWTSDEAIEQGVADHWKNLSDLAKEYRAIRGIQDELYKCDFADFDKLACGYGINRRANDPEAFLYRHRNLESVAPNWRGFRDQNGFHPGTVPWPVSPVEQLVWFVRKKSEPWCPTPSQIAAQIERNKLDAQEAMVAVPATPGYRGESPVAPGPPTPMSGQSYWNTPQEARR